MATPVFSSLTLVAIQAALQAGDILKRGFGTTYEISNKPGRQNFVTAYDKAAEASIISFIREHFPTHSFLAEESGLTEHANEEEVLWIIDPLDGTANFARHIPIFTISIAAYHKGKEACGVILQPLTQELFISEKGKGAFLNGVRLKVSETKNLEDAFMFAGLPYTDSDQVVEMSHFGQLLQKGVTLRNLGSAALALAYVAAGKADAFWMYHLYPWDIAAGQLMIQEAGGSVLKFEEKSPHSSAHIYACNRALNPSLRKILFNK